MRISWLEKTFAVFTLFLFTKPFIDTGLVEDGWISKQGDYLVWSVFLSVYAAAFLLLGKRQFLEWASKDKLLLLLLSFVLLSLAWSEDPAITFKRTIALLGTVTVGIYFASRYSLKELVTLLAWSLGIAAVLSAIAGVAMPHYAVMTDEHYGAWRGIYVHKNILGRLMALSSISFLSIATGFRSHRLVGWVGFLFSVALLLASTSLTAVLVLSVLVFMAPLVNLMRRHPMLVPALVASSLVFASMVVWLTDSSPVLLKFLGRDPTFTGRVDLWQSAELVIEQNPWIGHGYGTAWVGEGDDAATDISRFSEWNAPNAHNGFLNLTLDLGLLGLVSFLLGYVVAVRRSVAYIRNNLTAADIWPCMFLVFVLLTNLTESVLLSYNNIDWLLYVATVVSLAHNSVGYSRPLASQIVYG